MAAWPEWRRDRGAAPYHGVQGSIPELCLVFCSCPLVSTFVGEMLSEHF